MTYASTDSEFADWLANLPRPPKDQRVGVMVLKLVNLLDFAAADHGEFFDKGKTVPYVYYYGRVHEGQHQRVSLITHPTSGRGEFLQFVVQVFDKAPSVGRPKGALPRFLHASEPRCWEDLLAAVTRVYPLPKP